MSEEPNLKYVYRLFFEDTEGQVTELTPPDPEAETKRDVVAHFVYCCRGMSFSLGENRMTRKEAEATDAVIREPRQMLANYIMSLPPRYEQHRSRLTEMLTTGGDIALVIPPGITNAHELHFGVIYDKHSANMALAITMK